MNKRPPGGFLLIESMIAGVVLTVAAAAVATLLVASAKSAAVGRENTAAALLATQLLEEIAARPLYPPNGVTLPSSTPTLRSQFLTIGMYDGYFDSTAAAQTSTGTPILSPGAGFRRSVSVVYQAGPGGCTAAATEFAVVRVTVTTPTGRAIVISRLVGRVDLNG